MALNNNEEKDLIGSILNEQDDDQSVKEQQTRKKLSLNSKAFEYPNKMQIQDYNSSNPSFMSTGQLSHPPNRGFFKTQTSIEMQQPSINLSQYPTLDVPVMDYEKSSSIEQLQFMLAFYSGEQLQKRSPKKKNTAQIQEHFLDSGFYISDQQIQGTSVYSQFDLEQICGNQAANRKLQNMLEYGNEQTRMTIFQKVEQMALKASKDMFGNYTVQKILEVGNFEQKRRIYISLKDHLIELSRNVYGCRVVQKLLDFIKFQEEESEQFLLQVKSEMKILCFDQYGNFVLLSCLENFRKDRVQFFIPFVEESFIFMAKQTYGCRIIQKILELFSLDLTQKLYDSLLTICFQLCFSEYGNYVVQFILQNGHLKYKLEICEIIKSNFEQLCVNKFGSNTVEKYIDYFGPSQIMKQLTSLSYNSEFVFYNLSINSFGNYVMKKVLISGDPSLIQLRALLKQYPEIIQRIKLSEYGYKVGQILENL